MGKLQNITLATAITILGLSTVKITNANASTISSNSQLISLRKGKAIAAESSPVNQLELSQKPDTASTDEKSSQNGDEMLDAVQKRQEKIENLKELKQIQDKYFRCSRKSSRTRFILCQRFSIFGIRKL